MILKRIGLTEEVKWLGHKDLWICPPINYFLWGHMKSVVFDVWSNTRVELIGKVMEYVGHLKNDGGIVMRVINSLSERLDNHGGHFEHRTEQFRIVFLKRKL